MFGSLAAKSAQFLVKFGIMAVVESEKTIMMKAVNLSEIMKINIAECDQLLAGLKGMLLIRGKEKLMMMKINVKDN